MHDGPCSDDRLCSSCYGRELAQKRGQADRIGSSWAEQICRGKLRARLVGPEHEPRTLEIARRLVARLAMDPRLVEALAAACGAGAVECRRRRSVQYRIEFVTEPGEREQCCAVIGGERCEGRTAFRIAAEDGALDDYTYTCADHAELAAGPGYVVTPVEQGEDEAHPGVTALALASGP